MGVAATLPELSEWTLQQYADQALDMVMVHLIY